MSDAEAQDEGGDDGAEQLLHQEHLQTHGERGYLRFTVIYYAVGGGE